VTSGLDQLVLGGGKRADKFAPRHDLSDDLASRLAGIDSIIDAVIHREA
jgi:hypothetical protein